MCADLHPRLWPSKLRHRRHSPRPKRQRVTSRETKLRNGHRILIRPIRPQDKDGLLEGLHHLTPASRYRRFFSPMPELSTAQLRYLTEVDHRNHEALIAFDADTGEGIGVARFIRSVTEPTAAEMAVAVLDTWHGRGVGTALLEALVARAREEGVERFTASVLAENAPMLRLLRQLGDVTVADRGAGYLDLRVELRGGKAIGRRLTYMTSMQG
jgi:GNAT superfamily N-acetyltransferase